MTEAAFVIGLGVFLVGTVVAFTVSWSIGEPLFSIGAFVIGGSRLAARRRARSRDNARGV